ncbi:hypothetical protein P879_02615 [Paragonimus westermani]|uniref:DIX domain-containing protein n=1 Tax=Paragonimus westermani TaxID=34504 RepID=A0A8T0DWY9_9TREM|nr:hypothetical protein P879_02615 [Paragonimus westermani]
MRASYVLKRNLFVLNSSSVSFSCFTLEHSTRADPAVTQSPVSSSVPLEASQCEHQFLLNFSDTSLEGVPVSTSREVYHTTTVSWDKRLAVEVEHGLSIQSPPTERTVAEASTSKVPDKVGQISPHSGFNTMVDVSSADFSSPHERLRHLKLHSALTQFTWAQTLFNQASYECARNPVSPNAILDEHLTRVWRDRTRMMIQEDELDGLPKPQLSSRRTRRSSIRSRLHPWNRFTQLVSGLPRNIPGVEYKSDTRDTHNLRMRTGCLTCHLINVDGSLNFRPNQYTFILVSSSTQYQARCASLPIKRNDQRNFRFSGKRAEERTVLSAGVSSSGYIVLYSLPGVPLPYVTYWPRRQSPTLGQFKQIVWERLRSSPYSTELTRLWRYFFKCISDEFSPGVVYQECTLNLQSVPLWKGHVWAKIEMDG